jgi:hypothetical protein
MSQASKVSGVVEVDGSPAERTVRAFGYEATAHNIDSEAVTLSKSLGHATSDPGTGEYTIDLLAGYNKRIFVVAFDDYGDDFSPDMALSVGDRVHPAAPNGYVWECTGAGALPSEEPDWVVDTETAQLYGTASMIAKPFYRPMVHGPVTPEVTSAAVLWAPQSGNTVFWFDAQDEASVALDGSGKVSSLTDLSSGGNDLNQTSTGARPSITDINGFQALACSGNEYLQSTVDVTVPSGSLLFSMVVEKGAPTSDGYEALFQIAGFGAFTLTHYSKSSGALLRWQAGSGSENLTQTTQGTYPRGGLPAHVLTLSARDGAGVSVRIDGLTVGLVTDPGEINPPGVSGILSLFFGSGFSSSANWSGKLGEILLEPADLETQEIEIREGYLAHKWGLEGSLPSNHSYKDEPPTVA